MSVAKLKAAECAQTVIQLHGGDGVLDESRIACVYRDARTLVIYEGVSAVQRDVVYESFQ